MSDCSGDLGSGLDGHEIDKQLTAALHGVMLWLMYESLFSSDFRKIAAVRSVLWCYCGLLRSMGDGRCRSDGRFRELIRDSSVNLAAKGPINASKCSLMSYACKPGVPELQRPAAR
jgi:hypothetical protein